MENSVIEVTYPLSFRELDAKVLGNHLKNRQSVVLIGMKRVGISNFLRFFLYHKDTPETYIQDGKNHLFIPVDLNDLVERELSPFWTLTLKRIADAVEASKISEKGKKQIQSLFLDSIQSQDLFLTIDSIRRALVVIDSEGYLPTIFFLRFDRIKDAVTPEFFSNLQGLKDATHHKLTYVFTSYRSLDKLVPQVFTRASLSVFSNDMHIKPANTEDTVIVLKTYKDRYKLTFEKPLEEKLLEEVDGYIQYVQLALIVMSEKKEMPSKDEIFRILSQDERIALQSDELWESLDPREQEVIVKVSQNGVLDEKEREEGRYLWDTGFIIEKDGKNTIFSPLFQYYLEQKTKQEKHEGNGVEFSKKEHLLFSFLESHQNEVCEREKIIEAVWPEEEALGVSDWAIDRLVARVRNKLKLRKSLFEIQTIKTRGYKLIPLVAPRE